MQSYEKLGAFYLGRVHDLRNGKTLPDQILYDSKDLTTHAVVLGMTGSGKTGLCLTLLEEAAIDGIPAIAIDLKGDLGNLMLSFPNLQPGDFLPWIDAEEATRNGMTVEQYAASTAKLWRDGLAQWDQDGSRIARFRESARPAIYTPGSSAGLQLTVLTSFAAPPAAVIEDADAFRERISTSVSGLLALLGITADPIRSREHILLSNLLDRAWRDGRDLDIASLIREIQSPPFDKVGFMQLDDFFPSKDRFALSMTLNNLVASPSFASWMEGEPLNVRNLLYTADGKPRLAIVSIAHLSESERMFFVTILLNEVLSWIRSQPGTSSLRALLYMDEVFGYFPPTANPPSKTPMLTLLKQARAYGLGVVLATQNPVDLDYKGLSNAGTWLIGRLQTERDKMRVLEGLEGASAAAGSNFNRATMEATLGALGKRVFLMNNVHEDEPVVFHTRWALSYLRGPMTRTQIKALMADQRHESPQAETAPPAAPGPTASAAPAAATAPPSAAAVPAAPTPAKEKPAARAVAPAEADECFIAIRQPRGDDRIVYRAGLVGMARLHFVRATYKVDSWLTAAIHVGVDDEVPDDVWAEAEPLEDADIQFDSNPLADAQLAELPAEMAVAKQYARWSKALKDHLYREQTLTVWKCIELKQYSQVGETEGDFRIRLKQLAAERRDTMVEKFRQRYSSKLSTLKDRLRRAEERVDREKSQYGQSKVQSAISFGSSVLGALFGRKVLSSTNVRRAGSTARSIGRASQQKDDIRRAEENVEQVEEKLADMEEQFQAEVDKVEDTVRVDSMEFEQLQVRPRKSDIVIEKVALAWSPWRVDSTGIASRAH